MRLAHGRFVYADPEAIALGDREEAVRRGQNLRVGDEAGEVVPDIVMNAERHFLQHDIGRGCRELQAGSQG